VAVQQLNRRCQLHNGWGGSDGNSGNKNDDEDNNTEMITMETTTTATTMAVGSIKINAGSDAAAALHQRLTMQGKQSGHHIIGTLQRQQRGQCHHANKQMAGQEWAAECTTRA
jgi:hypothetical protein